MVNIGYIKSMFKGNFDQLTLLSLMAGALVQWLWEETHVLKVMGSNTGTLYWMDIISQIFVVKIVMMFV